MHSRSSTTRQERDNSTLLQRKPALHLGKKDSAYEQEADRIADAVVRGSARALGWSISKASILPGRDLSVQRKSESSTHQSGDALNSVHKVLQSSGQPLESKTRDFMESRIGRDFSHVRIHADSLAGESARAIGARAYANGSNVVFASGQYKPDSRVGRYLLAHELVHVAQQSTQQMNNTGLIQRVGFFESVARFFGGGTFTEEELLAYIDFLKKKKTIEDAYDSDNKAREVVLRWKKGDAAFSFMPVPLRILLIKEMASGYLSGDDQNGILALLEDSIPSERTTIIREIGIDKLKVRFDGKKRASLLSLLSDQEDEEAMAAMGGKWSVKGVMEILHRHGDEHVLKTVIDQGYSIIRFETAFDKWRYDDGTIKENEIKGLRGNILRGVKEIRIRDSLSNETAASTFYHEASHAQSKEPDRIKQEIDVRVETEEFKIRHGLPPTRAGYRNPDGTVNRAFIKNEIEKSPHYKPVGRKRIGRRYVNEKKISGWKMP